MKIYVLAPKENWICDRIAQEWKDNCSDYVTENIHDADIVWLLAGWCWNHVPIELLRTKKVILTVHHIVPEKFDETKINEFRIRDQIVDAYHVPNSKTASIVSQLTNKPIYICSYWYEPKLWSPISKNKSQKYLGLPSDKFIVGSFQRDTEGGSLKPKLEKGPDLFCDFVEKISKVRNVHVLLGGWRRGFVINRLEKNNIPFTFFEQAPIEKLKMMYGACDLYVVASRYEGGPQAILEAAAMKVPIVSTDVGIASSVLSPYCIIDIPEQVYVPSSDLVEKNYQNVQQYSIVLHKLHYLKIFESIL
mgnify:CR=1 FL=1